MASLFKRNGTYHLSWLQDGKTRMKSTKTGDRKLALELLRKLEEDLIREEQGIKQPEKLVPIRLDEFIRVYLEDRRKQMKAARTVSTDEYALHRLLEGLGNCRLVEITDTAVRRYRDQKLKALRPASLAIELRHLRAAFSWAADKPAPKYLHQNPFKQKGIMPTHEHKTVPQCLSPEEKARFFEAIADPGYKQLFQFMLLTGCRRSEAIRLQWGDIDLEQKQITFTRTKSKKDRVIPMNLELMQIVLNLDRSRERPFPYHPDWITHLFRRYLKQAGISKDLHLHCLRHTAASDLVRAGVHLTKIQKFLGHSSVKVTEIYTHVLPEDLREVAEVLSCTA
ncbi:MAG: site-specific integrase [Candidatus Zixiibacteriota bacterium]|nr:MAG: site-specific integrase [candidate division Zixibacteria bacterium]